MSQAQKVVQCINANDPVRRDRTPQEHDRNPQEFEIELPRSSTESVRTFQEFHFELQISTLLEFDFELLKSSNRTPNSSILAYYLGVHRGRNSAKNEKCLCFITHFKKRAFSIEFPAS